MKFLIEAHLLLALCAILRSSGHDATHTSQLPARNRTADQLINEISPQCAISRLAAHGRSA
ncbi:MAG: hypothetical protein ABI651_20905 [Verrucomicrobiota bacterium]